MIVPPMRRLIAPFSAPPPAPGAPRTSCGAVGGHGTMRSGPVLPDRLQLLLFSYSAKPRRTCSPWRGFAYVILATHPENLSERQFKQHARLGRSDFESM